MEDPKEPIERDERGRFGAGNKAGMGTRRMASDVREMFKDSTPLAAKKIIDCLEATKFITTKDGMQEVPDRKLQVECANHILDRVAGRPAQTILGDEESPLRVNVAEDLVNALRGIVTKPEEPK